MRYPRKVLNQIAGIWGTVSWEGFFLLNIHQISPVSTTGCSWKQADLVWVWGVTWRSHHVRLHGYLPSWTPAASAFHEYF